MHIPVLGLIGTAVGTLWNKLRGRPTVQADRGSVAAGGDQTINAPVATGRGVIATDQATVVASPSGGPTIIVQSVIVQSGGTLNLGSYVDGLPQAKDPVLRAAFEDGQRLQLEGYQQEGYAAQSAHKHKEAIDRFTKALALAETDSQRAALHILRGNSQYSISQYKEAEADYQETLRLAERISPAREAARARAPALGNLGIVYGQRNGPGDLDKAEEHHTKALEIDREIGYRRGEAADLGNLGTIYGRRGGPGNLDKAEDCFRQALEIHREIGYRRGEAHQLGNLGNVYLIRGDLAEAEKHYQEALDIHREIGYRLGEAQDMGNLGTVYLRRGDPGDLDKAEEHSKQALDIHREIGNRAGEALQMANLGLVYIQRGDTKNARDYLQQAQAIYQEIGAGGENPENARQALEIIAELERQQERGEKQHPEG